MGPKAYFMTILLLVIVVVGLYFFNLRDEGGVYFGCKGIRIVTKVYKNSPDPGKFQQTTCIGILEE